MLGKRDIIEPEHIIVNKNRSQMIGLRSKNEETHLIQLRNKEKKYICDKINIYTQLVNQNEDFQMYGIQCIKIFSKGKEIHSCGSTKNLSKAKSIWLNEDVTILSLGIANTKKKIISKLEIDLKEKYKITTVAVGAEEFKTNEHLKAPANKIVAGLYVTFRKSNKLESWLNTIGFLYDDI